MNIYRNRDVTAMGLSSNEKQANCYEVSPPINVIDIHNSSRTLVETPQHSFSEIIVTFPRTPQRKGAASTGALQVAAVGGITWLGWGVGELQLLAPFHSEKGSQTKPLTSGPWRVQKLDFRKSSDHHYRRVIRRQPTLTEGSRQGRTEYTGR